MIIIKNLQKNTTLQNDYPFLELQTVNQGVKAHRSQIFNLKPPCLNKVVLKLK